MKLITLQEEFSKAVGIVSRFVLSKTQLPILSNILLCAQNGKLRISATNLEIGIHVWIGADIKKEGSTTVSARTLQEVLNTMRSGRIEINKLEEEILQMQSNGARVDLPTAPVNDFPAIASELPQASVAFSGALLGALSYQVAFAAGNEDLKPQFTGVLFLPSGEKLNIVATDGVRLSKKQISLGAVLDEKILVPARVIAELPKIIGVDKENLLKMAIQKQENQVMFATSNVVLVSRLIDANFPDFERIIPTGWVARVIIDKEEFGKAMQRASVFAEDFKVDLSVENNKVVLTSSHPQFGSQTSELLAKTEGENIRVSFNCRFLRDVLNAISGEELIIELTGQASPGVFKDPKDESFLHLIMPIRINRD